MENPIHDWKIRIGNGYGTFDFRGTEAEAEEMRVSKANWWQARGVKWMAADPEPSNAPR